jgi:putative transcriptional regulator
MLSQPDNFATSVKTLRAQLGLSQEDLAKALGVSFASVNRWENGKTQPSKLAKSQFENFCQRQRDQGRL